MIQITKKRYERGAVSLFVVVFSALLVTVMSVSFVALMIQGQRQAIADDLSRSAYDSAQAGVEDAKRALVKYSTVCADGDTLECDRLAQVFGRQECDTLQKAGVVPLGKEVMIKQQVGDEALQQAYTCVKVTPDSEDYIGTLTSGTSRLVPLRGTQQFDRISLEWFTEANLDQDDEDGANTVELPQTDGAVLPKLDEWSANRPALMRSQLIQFGTATAGFQLSDFDNSVDGKSNTNTLFLYPSGISNEIGPEGVFSYLMDSRKSKDANILRQVKCEDEFNSNRYACKATILLPQAIGQSNNERTAFLRLNGLYGNGNDFRIQLFNGSTPVKFAGAQAVVDSTGRANDQFRRVQSRVELDVSSFPYPEAAVDITGNLCKTFLVTNNAADYDRGECDPSA